MRDKVEPFLRQIERTEKRYEREEEKRAAVAALATGRLKKGDWKRIDDEGRILRRLRARGEDRAAGRLLETNQVQIAGVVPGTDERPELNLLERILGENDLLGSAFLPVGSAVCRSVGRIITRATGFGFGTGFMVSDRLLMTNNHVLENRCDAEESAVQFDFFVQPGGNLANPVVFLLEPNTFLLTDLDLDYTLVAVQPQNSAGRKVASRGWSPLIAESGKALVTRGWGESYCFGPCRISCGSQSGVRCVLGIRRYRRTDRGFVTSSHRRRLG